MLYSCIHTKQWASKGFDGGSDRSMSATAVPATACRAVPARRERPITAETGYYDRQCRQSRPSATRSVQLATTWVGFFLGVDHPAATSQSQSGARAAREEVDDGGKRVGSVATRPDGVVCDVVHLLTVDAVSIATEKALRRLVGDVRRRAKEGRSRGWRSGDWQGR